MSYAVLPAKRSPKVPDDVATDVFCALRRLIALWRNNADKLAVALAAYSLAGYHAPAWEVAAGYHDAGVPPISDEEAHRLIDAALYNRRRDVLRHRAEGLLLALEALAGDVEAHRLHDAQVGVGLRACDFRPRRSLF